MRQLQFHIVLARFVFKPYSQENLPEHLIRRGRSSSEPTPARLLSRHFPSLIPATENTQHAARRCYVCSQTENENNRVRHELGCECTIWSVALCVDRCFRIYHIALNF
jgi:hypothetical protein